MFQMLTGELPLKPKTSSFEGWFHCHQHQAPKSFDRVKAKLDLPQALMNVVNQCMAKTAAERPASVTELLKTLERIEKELAEAALPTTRELSEELSALSKTPNQVEHGGNSRRWPQDKPRAEIVFPQSIEENGGSLATLWIMLSREDIEKYKQNRPHAQFLFVASPHPMLLWLTTLYQDEQHHRMLPCYLDLKKPAGEKILQLLIDTAKYQLFLFALEGDDRCVCKISGHIVSKKVTLLSEWLHESRQLPPAPREIKESKRWLKEELNVLKPKLVASLQRQISKKPKV